LLLMMGTLRNSSKGVASHDGDFGNEIGLRLRSEARRSDQDDDRVMQQRYTELIVTRYVPCVIAVRHERH
jgi:hypothetical protein